MTACTDCQKFAEYSFWNGYNSDCLECRARDIAKGPEYFNAVAAKSITQSYRDALSRAFGGDWTAWHARVKAYAAKGKA